jgi:hypothetical protein
MAFFDYDGRDHGPDTRHLPDPWKVARAAEWVEFSAALIAAGTATGRVMTRSVDGEVVEWVGKKDGVTYSCHSIFGFQARGSRCKQPGWWRVSQLRLTEWQRW